MGAHGLEEVQGSKDVYLGVMDGVRDGVADVDLGGMVDHAVEPDLFQEGRELWRAEIHPDKLGPGVDLLALAAGKIIHHPDLMVRLDERVHDIGSDKACTAGYQDFHSY